MALCPLTLTLTPFPAFLPSCSVQIRNEYVSCLSKILAQHFKSYLSGVLEYVCGSVGGITWSYFEPLLCCSFLLVLISTGITITIITTLLR